MNKNLVLGFAVLQTVLGAQTVGAAGESNLETYTLDTVVVTANRYEKPDVATAASTEIVTEKRLKDSGATNAQEALNKVPGIISDASRAGGGAVNPFSNSEIEIRGTSGTLVLVNGMPLNLGNRYQLNDIPVENIKKIEIVKGGGAVLYGSEAIGGVINIITKDTRPNSVKVGFGNHGRQNHGVTAQAGKLGVGYDYTKWGSLDHTSDYNGKYNNTGNAETNSFNANYKFDDKWAFNVSHNEGRQSSQYFSAADVLLLKSAYTTREDYAQLLYNDNSVRGSLYYNYADIGYNSFGSAMSGIKKTTKWNYKKEQNSVIGGDLQKVWDVKAGKFLLGGDFKHEYFNPDSNGDVEDYKRNIFSVFGSWDKDLDVKNNLILSTRGTWTAASPNSDNFYNISSQVQYLHKLDNEQSLYISAGQSFKMPTFKQIYGSVGTGTIIEANPNVKPQTGIHYELGWKKLSGAHNWKAALFNEYIEDNISAVTSKDNTYQYTNEDMRNTGIELSCTIDKGEGWNYNYGLTYQNPMVQSTSKTGSVTEWQHKYGKIQLTGGVGYAKDKWRASLQANYLADRYMLLSSGAHECTKPYLLTSLNVTYAMDKRQEFNLTVDNLLNREDNMGHTGTYYYTAPVNFMLSYKYKF